MTISEMLARNRRMHPRGIALIERTPGKNEKKQVTWKEFDERVTRIANALVMKGVGRGDVVVHWMVNSIQWLEAYLGIVRAGAIAAPLNFRFTGKDFEHCVDVAEPRVAILDEQFADRARAVDHPLLPTHRCLVNGEQVPPGMESFQKTLAESSADPVNAEIRDDDPCGLYFTSGTTGAPKPILLTHKNMECAAITGVLHGLRRTGDVWVTLKPFYHTGDWIHWLASLILGGTSVIQRDRITPRVIFDCMDEEKGTVTMLLVPWLQDILASLDGGEIKREEYDLSCWRLVLLGAQYVPPSLVRRWKEKFPDMLYEVNYGLTEASGPGCIHLGIENGRKLGSIGKPGFNWEARIVDGKGREVSPGEIGEIVVRGNGVMREYYKNPEKTAETIRDGWLYTGDMGKVDDDGFFWFVDRKKDVIICGGENIYPVEIEEILQEHPKVHDVGVIGIPNERMGEIVAAVIDLESDVLPSLETEKEISDYCGLHLPKYKRPRQIMFDKVLRGPTGKIEKRKLRQKYEAI